MARLSGKKIAILATDGFEQVELTDPKETLEQAEAEVHIVAPKTGSIRGWKFREWGDEFPVDRTLDEADPADYDGLVLPGGVLNPDKLRMETRAVDFVKAFFEANKPVAAICHGPQMLIEADVVRGRRMTSYQAIRTDLVNAGVDWVDEPVVEDRGLVTSRKPDDLLAFRNACVELFERGEASHRAAAE